MAGKLSRFLHLEGPRQGRKDEGPQRADGRFESLEAKPEVPAAGSSAVRSALPRFEAPVEQPKPPTDQVELSEPIPAELSFIRCAKCEADSNGFATSCRECGASFDTPEQHEFNGRMQEWVRAHAEASAAQDAEKKAHREAELQALLARGQPEPEPDLPPWLRRYWPRHDVLGDERHDGKLLPVDQVVARIAAFVVPLAALPLVIKTFGWFMESTRRKPFPLFLFLAIGAYQLSRWLWRYSESRD